MEITRLIKTFSDDEKIRVLIEDYYKEFSEVLGDVKANQKIEGILTELQHVADPERLEMLSSLYLLSKTKPKRSFQGLRRYVILNSWKDEKTLLQEMENYN